MNPLSYSTKSQEGLDPMKTVNTHVTLLGLTFNAQSNNLFKENDHTDINLI